MLIKNIRSTRLVTLIKNICTNRHKYLDKTKVKYKGH